MTQQRFRRCAASVTLLIGISTQAPLIADDWPHFRGPNYDGVSGETGLKTEWSTPIPLVWERKVGSAFSSFAVVGDRVYTGGTENKQQTLVCLSAANGDVLWQSPVEAEYVERQGGDGPRATPTVADGRVYTMGARGRLLCVDAASGKEIWSRAFGGPPIWGYSASVLIEGGRAIVSAGGRDGALAAFDARSGEPVWKTGTSKAGYATPYPFTHEGVRYVAGFVADGLLVVRADDGREVWSLPWETDWDVNAAAPIYHEGHLFFSSGYGTGACLVRLETKGERLSATEVWRSKVLRNKFQSSVLHDGHLYASDERALRCVEFLTGAERWNVPRIQDSTLVLAQGHVFLLTEEGELQIAAATPSGFNPKTTARILDGRCWSVPVLHNGRLYARDQERVVAFQVRP